MRTVVKVGRDSSRITDRVCGVKLERVLTYGELRRKLSECDVQMVIFDEAYNADIVPEVADIVPEVLLFKENIPEAHMAEASDICAIMDGVKIDAARLRQRINKSARLYSKIACAVQSSNLGELSRTKENCKDAEDEVQRVRHELQLAQVRSAEEEKQRNTDYAKALREQRKQLREDYKAKQKNEIQEATSKAEQAFKELYDRTRQEYEEKVTSLRAELRVVTEELDSLRNEHEGQEEAHDLALEEAEQRTAANNERVEQLNRSMDWAMVVLLQLRSRVNILKEMQTAYRYRIEHANALEVPENILEIEQQVRDIDTILQRRIVETNEPTDDVTIDVQLAEIAKALLAYQQQVIELGYAVSEKEQLILKKSNELLLMRQTYEARIASLEVTATQTAQEREDANSRALVSSYADVISDKEAKITALETDLAQVKAQLAALTSSGAAVDITEVTPYAYAALKERYVEGQRENAGLTIKAQTMAHEQDKLRASVAEYKEKLDTANSDLQQSKTLLTTLNDEIERIKFVQAEKDRRLKESETELERLRVESADALSRATRESLAAHGLRTSLNAAQPITEQENRELKQQLEQTKKDLEALRSDTVYEKMQTRVALTEKEKDIVGLQSQVEVLTKDLELARLRGEGGTVAKSELLRQMQDVNTQLQGREAELRDAATQLEQYKKLIFEQKAKISALQNATHINAGNAYMEELATSARNVGSIAGYVGTARIIPCFGLGSSGVTSVAMSLLARLSQYRLLYMDLDCVNPKADGWFRVTPVCKNLKGIKNEGYRTGFGSLLTKGADYVLENMPSIIKEVSNGGTTADYFSGSYETVTEDMLMRVDIGTVLNTLGQSYDYIIIDLGKLGCSTLNDAMIKAFTEIAYKAVVVSVYNILDVRAMNGKINGLGIKRDNMIWVLNMIKGYSRENSRIDTYLEDTLKVRISYVSNYFGELRPMSSIQTMREGMDGLVGEVTGTKVRRERQRTE